MKEKIIAFLKEKWNIVVYFMFSIILVISVLCTWVNDEPVNFANKEIENFSEKWIYKCDDGTCGVTNLPGNIEMDYSKHLLLRKKLPKVEDNMFVIFRARHTFIRVTVDGEIRIDQLTQEEEKKKWFSFAGINYYEIELNAEDSNKQIEIESYCSEEKYLSSPGMIFLGDKGTFIGQFVKNRISTLMCFLIVLIVGVILILLWVSVKLVTKQNIHELLCLALFTLSVAFWLLTETDLIQLMGYATRTLAILAFEILMLIPVPIALFFYYVSEREIGKKLSKIASIIPLILFLVNNILHLFHIASLVRTLAVTQTILGLELIFIAYIQISELRYIYISHKDSDKNVGVVPFIGILLFVPMALIEILKYRFSSTKFPNDGKLITVGVIIYIIALAIDSVIRINRKNTNIEHSIDVKNQFLANMSHEIRTPLNAILGFNEAILRSTYDEKVKCYSMNIHESGENLKDIINSILDITKIEMGELQINEREYNTVTLFDNLVSMFELLAERKGLKFHADIDENLPRILIGDEQHLRQVLVNILNNAIKYTDEGSVTLKVQVKEISENFPVCKILFSVKDTGVGIREEDRDRLFKKFERLNTEHFKNVEGSGLGMSIVLHTLLAMGSNIQLNSIFGIGSDFYFELEQCVVEKEKIGDFNERRAELAIKDFNNVDFRAPNANILIVDDVEMNLDAVCALLEFTKMNIDTVESGAEAIEAVKSKRYDMIFMDHMMPKMDGIEATEKIRNLAIELEDVYFAYVPIVALTANAIVGMKEVYQQSGMQDLVSKPVELEAIIHSLKTWLPAELIERANPAERMEESENASELDTTSVENEPAFMEEQEDYPIIEGIDIEEALKYNQGIEGLYKNMKSYIKSHESNRAEIWEYFQDGNVEDYTIKVHALKSTSKMIGAMELFNVAMEIEAKGHQGEMNEPDTTELLDLYDTFVDRLKEYFGMNDEEQLEDDSNIISQEEYDRIIQEIVTAAQNFDMGAFMGYETELADIVVPKEHKDEFDKLCNAIASLSFSEVLDILQIGEYDVEGD